MSVCVSCPPLEPIVSLSIPADRLPLTREFINTQSDWTKFQNLSSVLLCDSHNYCQAQPKFQLSPVPAVLGWDSINFNFSPPTPPHPPTPRESTVEDISSLWSHPWLLTSGPEPFDHATFVHASFVHATSVRATFVHATSVCAIFLHTTFVQGQNLIVYNCNLICLDQTIKFKLATEPNQNLVNSS